MYIIQRGPFGMQAEKRKDQDEFRGFQVETKNGNDFPSVPVTTPVRVGCFLRVAAPPAGFRN